MKKELEPFNLAARLTKDVSDVMVGEYNWAQYIHISHVTKMVQAHLQFALWMDPNKSYLDIGMGGGTLEFFVKGRGIDIDGVEWAVEDSNPDERIRETMKAYRVMNKRLGVEPKYEMSDATLPNFTIRGVERRYDQAVVLRSQVLKLPQLDAVGFFDEIFKYCDSILLMGSNIEPSVWKQVQDNYTISFLEENEFPDPIWKCSRPSILVK